jgi:uncharacterized protein (DUF362 family)
MVEQYVETYSAYVAEANEELGASLLKGLEFINWKSLVKKDSVVFVKPNFTFPDFQKGVTTNPRLLRCLLEILRDRSDSVILGESDGGNHSFRADEAFRGHQMYEICKQAGVKLVNLSTTPSRFVEAKISGKKVKVQLPNMLLDKVDCFISVPVLKVHVITHVSLGLKNLWGCYPDTMRGLHHTNLDRKLTLIAKLLKPKITVIDGLYGLNWHGPMYGDPVEMNLLLMSNNVVVADALGAAIMDIPLKTARHVTIAEEAGIGTTNLANARINTDWRKYQRHFQIRRTLLDRASSLLFHSDIAAKLVMDSPFTPLVYGVAGSLRSHEEKGIASRLKTYQM